MFGAITGDIIGSVYEFQSVKPEINFNLFINESTFTDDTVLTAAIADSLLRHIPFDKSLKKYYKKVLLTIEFSTQMAQKGKLKKMII